MTLKVPLSKFLAFVHSPYLVNTKWLSNELLKIYKHCNPLKKLYFLNNERASYKCSLLVNLLRSIWVYATQGVILIQLSMSLTLIRFNVNERLTLYWPKLLTTQVNWTSRPCVTVRLSNGWRNSGSCSIVCPRPVRDLTSISHYRHRQNIQINHMNSPFTNVITRRMWKRDLMMACWIKRTISILLPLFLTLLNTNYLTQIEIFVVPRWEIMHIIFSFSWVALCRRKVLRLKVKSFLIS